MWYNDQYLVYSKCKLRMLNQDFMNCIHFLNLSLQNILKTQTRCFENGIKVVGKSFQKYACFKDHQTLPPIQSYYREVPQWGVSNGARHNWECFLA